MQEIHKIGCVQTALIPRGWIEIPQKPDMLSDNWSRTFKLQANKSIEMSFYYRGMPVDKKSSTRLKEIIESKPARDNDEKLTPPEIKAMEVVMGYMNAGDNQYTNPSTNGREAPVFDLTHALTRHVNGKTVLFVQGAFKNGKHYAGIFYSADSSGQVIEEFMIHTPNKHLLNEHLEYFEIVLGSINWTR